MKVFENSIYASGRDISDLIMTREKLEYYHNRYTLTGMYQRSFIQSSTEAMVMPYQLPLSVIFIDLNGLKLINDSSGHDQGDELLRTISRKILSFQRESDIFVRYGGDEFVLLLPLASRIIAVADSFDAMTCGRAYTDCKTKEEAIQELRACSGSQFDPEVVSVFIEKVLLLIENTKGEDNEDSF